MPRGQTLETWLSTSTARQIVQQQPFSCPEDIFERVKGFGVRKCARMRAHACTPKESYRAWC